ncbi:MAG: hypothetical protein IH865_13190 [Chloroflexi bacterium]|nr:hypothetical protein [Chloroflexota bacterium]
MALDTAFQELTMLAVTGAGFGAEFPERFEELYANSYARQDPADWKRLHEAGLGIPPEQDEFVSLDTRTKNDLTMFAEYCAEFYPDYVAQLGLEEYVGG